jgi:hypothetical protein
VKEFYQGGVLNCNGDKTLSNCQKHIFTSISLFWTMFLTYIIVYTLNMRKRDIVDTSYHALCVPCTTGPNNVLFLLHREQQRVEPGTRIGIAYS